MTTYNPTTVAELQSAFSNLTTGDVIDCQGLVFPGGFHLHGARGGRLTNFKVTGNTWYPLYIYDALDIEVDNFEVRDSWNENLMIGAFPGGPYGKVTGKFHNFRLIDAGQGGMSVKHDSDIEVYDFLIDGTGQHLTGGASWGEGMYIGYNSQAEWEGTVGSWGEHDVTNGPTVYVHHGTFDNIERGEAIDYKPWSAGVAHDIRIIKNRISHSASITVCYDYEGANFGPWDVHDITFETVEMHPSSPYTTPAAFIIGGTGKFGKFTYTNETPGYGSIIRDLTAGETVEHYEAGTITDWSTAGTVTALTSDPWAPAPEPEPEPEPEPPGPNTDVRDLTIRVVQLEEQVRMLQELVEENIGDVSRVYNWLNQAP